MSECTSFVSYFDCVRMRLPQNEEQKKWRRNKKSQMQNTSLSCACVVRSGSGSGRMRARETELIRAKKTANIGWPWLHLFGHKMRCIHCLLPSLIFTTHKLLFCIFVVPIGAHLDLWMLDYADFTTPLECAHTCAYENTKHLWRLLSLAWIENVKCVCRMEYDDWVTAWWRW